MRASGKTIVVTGAVMSYSRINPLILVNTLTTSSTVRAPSPGQTKRYMTVSGSTVSSRVSESGRERTVSHTSVNGMKVEFMAMVYISGRMVIDMKESGTIV